MQRTDSWLNGFNVTAVRGLLRSPLTYLGALVVGADQVTKHLLRAHLPVHTAREIIPGFLNLVHARNTGAAFSMFAGSNTFGRRAFFVAVSTLALGVILYLLSRTPKQDAWTRRGLVLVFSGALGNLIDRLRFGEVVDFLDFYQGGWHWPAFNVADGAITVGAAMLLLALFSMKTVR